MNRFLYLGAKYCSLLIAFLILSCSKPSEKLIADGRSDYSIFVAPGAPESEKVAAKKLQFYLREITGVELPVVHSQNPGDRLVFVGFQQAPENLLTGLKPSQFENEEYIISGDGRQLLIAGGGTRGTLYGVVGYLSDYLGCRWYTKTVHKIPRQTTIGIPDLIDHQKPDFRYREVNWREAYEEEWSVHNRVIPTRLAIPDSLGGSFVIYPDRGHTFDLIIPPGKYFSTNPEYFSEIRGKRTAENSQLCLTNPEVQELTVKKVLEWAETKPNANAYSVTQNDNERFCTCEKCSAVNREEGSQSGTMIRFLNHVSREVRKIKPDIQLHTFAYTYTEEPPQLTKPEDNILIELCHYNYCSAHAIGECKSHTPFISRLEQWRKIAQNVTVWGYYVDFGFYLMPFPNLESIRKDVVYYKQQGAHGMYAEGCNIIGPQGGGEFSELKAWVFAQLMWDSKKNADQLIDEYLENVYGPAALPIRQYIDLLQEEVKDTSVFFNIWSSPVEVNYLSPKIVKKADSLFQIADKLTKTDPKINKRVEKASLPLLFTKLYFNAFGAGESYIPRGEAPILAEKFSRMIEEMEIEFQGSNESMPDLLNELIRRAKINDHFFKDWWIIGAFDSDERRQGFDAVFEPERKIDTTATILTSSGRELKWEKHHSGIFPYIDFEHLLTPNQNSVGYAYRTLDSPVRRKARFGAGSNDGIKVWINKKLVLSRPVSRRAAPNQDIIEVPLEPGSNEILIKVDQLARGWGFYFSEIKD